MIDFSGMKGFEWDKPDLFALPYQGGGQLKGRPLPEPDKGHPVRKDKGVEGFVVISRAGGFWKGFGDSVSSGAYNL